MIGTKYPSEMRTYIDPKTGHLVTQLTQNGQNFHMYFTDNSFDIKGNDIYFLSNRGYEGEIYNIFHMNLNSGDMTQLTDEPAGVVFNTITKTPDSQLIAYKTGNCLKVLNSQTGSIRTIYEDNVMKFGNIHISPDKKMIGFCRNERADVLPDTGPNYSGFKERMFAIKDGRVSVIGLDGTGFRDVWRDTHQLSHFQFSPDDSRIAMFCHEGPWNYVHQRIWILNMETSEVIPCFRQGEDDCVGHEFWTRDGNVLFDNRRAGHDGTISSDKTQVVTKEADSGQIPYFGFADKKGEVLKKIEMPFYCNHYHANNDSTLFVGDGVEDIVLIRIKDGQAQLTTLTNHNTTWKYQRSHCHPTFSWDGRKILYAADTDEMHCNLFLVNLHEGEKDG